MPAGTLGVYGDDNRFLTPAVLASEALMRLNDVLFLGRLVNRNYQQYFEGKIGDQISYKKPYYPIIQDGRVLDLSSDFNALYDEYGTLTIDTWKSAPFKFNAEELTHHISDLGERYLQPGVEELGHSFDEACGKVLGDSLFRYLGTPGTGLSLADIEKVPGYATEVSIPRVTNRFCLIEPDDMVQIRTALRGLTSQDRLVYEALKRSYIGSLSGWQIFESTNVGRMTCHNPSGSHSPQVNTSGSYQGDQLPTDGWEARSQKVLNKGQLIQIAGVYETSVRGTRQSTGRLMTFVVTEDVSSSNSGAATIPIYPELNAGTLMGTDGDGTSISKAGFKNVTTAAPNNAAITIIGTAGTTYRQALFATRDACTLASVRIIPPPSMAAEGNAYSAEDTQTGLSILIARDHEFRSLTEWHRMDAKWGVDPCYPEQGIRVVTSSVAGS